MSYDIVKKKLEKAYRVMNEAIILIVEIQKDLDEAIEDAECEQMEEEEMRH